MNTLSNLIKYSRLKRSDNLDNYELTEKDFYPPEDTRVYQSGVEDIIDGDSFADYVRSFYEDYENEIFDV